MKKWSSQAAGLSAIGRWLQRALWLPVGHLALVSLAGSLPPRRLPAASPRYKFRFLITARDEENQIEDVVSSINRLCYPRELFRITVIADNCKDATASRARAAGAEVWERLDPTRANKGAALAWAFERLLRDEETWDAVVIVDADASLSAGFLEAVNQRLSSGAQVVQGERVVANGDDTIVSRVGQVAAAAQWVLRPRGRTRLGGAAKLLGSGMAIRRDVLERCAWRAEGLAEDVEFWLDLLGEGIRPVQEPAAVVYDVMPTHLDAVRVQRSRWEAGRLALLRRRFLPGVSLALRRRDPVLAEALLSELALPNLSVTAVAAVAGCFTRLAGSREGARVAAAQLAVVAAHLALSLRAAQAPPAAYAALIVAPVAAVWRTWVTLVAMLKGRRMAWEGTPRGVLNNYSPALTS